MLSTLLGLKEGEAPFPWQERLLAEHFLKGEIPDALDIPTGLGKTSVIAIWTAARAAGAKIPRRLVYVVDRRAVVDQATTEAERIRAVTEKEPALKQSLGLTRPMPISTLRGQFVDNKEWLDDPSSPAIVVGTVDMIGSRLLFSGYGVSPKMRPYHAGLLGADALVVLDEAHLVPAFEDLLRQIEQGAKLFGPKDQDFRTLLPQFKLLSLSATGRQTASTPFTLSDADRSNAEVCKRLDAKKKLTTIDPPAVAEGSDGNEPKLARTLAEEAWELTQQGTAQVRCLVFCHARKDAMGVADELRNLAESANATEPTIELFVGGRRVKERIQASEALVRLGFLAGTEVTRERSAFLIATSAGEVGVDLDADHMVCDLVAWERMVQRLGRVNRRGDGDANVLVVVEGEATPSDKMKKAIAKRDAARTANTQLDEMKKKLSALQGEKTTVPKRLKKSADVKAAEEKCKQAEKELKQSISACQKGIKAFKDDDAKLVARHETDVARHRALRTLLATVGNDGSLSPEGLRLLRQRKDLEDTLRDATTVEPLRPELTRALVDAWSMTSLDEHPGRPEVDPWLRGFRPHDLPQTTVVWRRHLPVRLDGVFNANAAKRFFEAAPPHTSEQLEIDTHLVLAWLIDRAASVVTDKEAMPDATQVVAIMIASRGEVKGWQTLEELASVSKGKNESNETKKDREQRAEQLEERLSGATLVVDSRLGGLTDGLLNVKADTIADAADDSSTTWLVRADANAVPVTGFNIRHLRTGADDTDAASRTMTGRGWVERHRFVTEITQGEPAAALVIDGWAGDAATEDERSEAERPQQLDEHETWAEACAQQIAKRLGLEAKHEKVLALAARLHDEGKRASLWQRAFKAPLDGRPYAKTRGPIDFDILDGYRHELGSLPYVKAHDEFKKLSPDDQEFVLHLIAAHHGYARPVIGTNGLEDAPPSVADERALDVALRFARLSRSWGPWGLAWWESLLRAADQAASRRNQQRATAQKEPQ